MTQDFRDFNRQVVDAFRASGGRGELGPVHFENLVLLTTTGRRSGRARTVPLGSAEDDDGNLLLFASNMGAPTHPDWYRNLVAHPTVTVELPGDTFTGAARTATGDERAALWRDLLAGFPFFADHQNTAGDREIPLVIVDRPAAGG